jgi:DNA/RNA-binding domain of Phe-tRNA-synthetase-like protein
MLLTLRGASVELQVEEHSRLLIEAFVTRWPAPLGACETPLEAAGLLRAGLGSCSELQLPDAALRSSIRDMLRSRDFKPTGRSKPASEYLARASVEADGGIRAINPAVDVCNAVSLHSGIPISVVDLDKLMPPLQVRLAGTGESYVFNATGQVIALDGLLCLHDAEGPSANAIKDAQRTKTSESTRNTLSILWSSSALASQTAAALRLYHRLLAGAATIEVVSCTGLT